MTYILGWSHGGFNWIIADARYTKCDVQGTVVGTNMALKTGKLFPGCAFGRAGNASTGRDFVKAAKKALFGRRTVPQFWKRFQDFVAGYQFPRGRDDRFELLLSTRVTGQPRFFILDSRAEALVPRDHEEWVSLGSGRKLLDEVVKTKFAERLDATGRMLEDEGVTEADKLLPYFICLWLSELTLGMEGLRLAECGVGGVFHFVGQSRSAEGPQQPSLYVLSAADPRQRQIHLWEYRVCPVNGCVLVESASPMPPVVDRVLLCDPASRLDIETRIADPTFVPEMWSQAKARPWYLFCGFGFMQEEARHQSGYHITTKSEYAVSRDGTISPVFLDKIAQNFDATYSMPTRGSDFSHDQQDT